MKVARDACIEMGGCAAAWKRNGCRAEDNPFAVTKAKRTTAPLFRELVQSYIDNHLQHKSLNPKKAVEDTRSMLKNQFAALLETPVDKITANDVLAVKNACGARRFAANHAVEFVKRIYTWSAGS